MIYAESGNRVTQIKEDDIQKYVEKGCRILDEDGNVVHDAIPNDVPNLKLMFQKHVAEINDLKKQIADLEKQIADLKAVKKTIVTETKVADTVSDTENVEIPKQTRKRKAEAEA